MDKRLLSNSFLGLYLLLIAGLFAGYLTVSMVRVDTACQINGPSEIEIGRPNAIQGRLYSVRTGKVLESANVSLESSQTVSFNTYTSGWPRRSRASATELEQFSAPRGFFFGHIQPPRSVLGPKNSPAREPARHLVLRVDGPQFDRFSAEVETRFREYAPPETWWPDQTSRRPKSKTKPGRERWISRPKSPDVTVQLYPRNHELVQSLPGQLTLATFEAETGEPVSCDIALERNSGRLAETLPSEVTTDSLGLTTIELQPITDLAITVVLETCGTDAAQPIRKLRIPTVPAQVVTRLRKPLATEGGAISLTVDSITRSDKVIADLYRANAWFDTARMSPNQPNPSTPFKVPKVEGTPRLFRIQTYRSFYRAGNAWDAQYFVGMPDSGNPNRHRRGFAFVVKRLANQLDSKFISHLASNPRAYAGKSTDAYETWTGQLLRAMPRSFAAPPELLDTQAAATTQLNEWKASLQQRLFWLTAVAIVLGILIVIHRSIIGFRRRLDSEKTEPEPDLDESADTQIQSNAALTLGVQVFAFILLLGLFGYSLLLLLWYV